MSHVYAPQVLTVTAASVSSSEAIHSAGSARCSKAAPTDYFLTWRVYSHTHTQACAHVCVCALRGVGVRGGFTVGMCAIVIVPRRQVAWRAIYFIQRWL